MKIDRPHPWRRFLAAFALILAASASAQTPTPEQLDIFRNLTPEQQQALMEQLSSPEQGTVQRQGSGSSAQPVEEPRRRADTCRLRRRAV